MVPGVLLEPYMSQGDQGVAETPIVLKGLRSHMNYHVWILVFHQLQHNSSSMVKESYQELSSSLHLAVQVLDSNQDSIQFHISVVSI